MRKKKDFKIIILEYLLKNKEEYISKSKIFGQIHRYKCSNLREASVALDYLYEIGAIKTANFHYKGEIHRVGTFDCKITLYGIQYLEKLQNSKITIKSDSRLTNVHTYHVPPDLLQNALKQGFSIDELIKTYN